MKNTILWLLLLGQCSALATDWTQLKVINLGAPPGQNGDTLYQGGQKINDDFIFVCGLIAELQTNLYTVGTVTTAPAGTPAQVLVTETNGAFILDFTLPAGSNGVDAVTLTLTNTLTGAPGSQASVTNLGTAANPILQFTLPQGATGLPGTNGANGTNGLNGQDGVNGFNGLNGTNGANGLNGTNAVTLTLTNTVTGAAGSSAAVTNLGTAANPILQFTLPQGVAGAPGAAGSNGTNGLNGTNGIANAVFFSSGVITGAVSVTSGTLTISLGLTNVPTLNGNNTFSGTNTFRGSTNGTYAGAGYVGEVISTNKIDTGSLASLSNVGTVGNVLSITLTPGDWDVSANLNVDCQTVNQYYNLVAGISTTSATMPSDGTQVYYTGAQISTTFTGSSIGQSITLPPKQINVTTSTTVYLVASINFSAGGAYPFGSLRARRMR